MAGKIDVVRLSPTYVDKFAGAQPVLIRQRVELYAKDVCTFEFYTCG